MKTEKYFKYLYTYKLKTLVITTYIGTRKLPHNHSMKQYTLQTTLVLLYLRSKNCTADLRGTQYQDSIMKYQRGVDRIHILKAQVSLQSTN